MSTSQPSIGVGNTSNGQVLFHKLHRQENSWDHKGASAQEDKEKRTISSPLGGILAWFIEETDFYPIHK